MAGVGPLPPAIDRVADLLPRGRSDDGWYATHVRDEVGVVRGVDAQVPPEARLVEHLNLAQPLETAVHDRADVLEARGRPTSTRRKRSRDQRVLGSFVVVRQLEVDALAEQGRVAPELVLPRPLGLESGVPQGAENDGVVVAAADARGGREKEANRVGGTRLDARGAESGAQAQAVDPAPFREERLLGNDVRAVHLRVIHGLEVRSEGAVAIGS